MRPCPACYQDIDDAAGECPRCRTIIPPPAMAPLVRKPRWFVSLALFAALAFAITYCRSVFFPSSTESDDAALAQAVVRDESATPSTIKFFGVDVRESRADGWVLAFAEYDEQNEFGALLRRRNFVTFQKIGTKYQWDKRYAVQDLGGERPTGQLLSTFKSMNGWPSEAK